ncbi:single-stranded DNA-binding protein [Elizabethkingia ursingii]
MANLFHAVINGNLTSDATFRKIAEDKGVINFTLAHNFATSKKDAEGKTIYEAQFYDCTRWVNTSEEPKALLDNLKKGSKIIVEVSKIEINTSEKDGIKYKNVNFVISNILL